MWLICNVYVIMCNENNSKMIQLVLMCNIIIYVIMNK